MSLFKSRSLTSEEQHDRMLKTPMPKLIVTLAVPTVMSQLISVIYNTADTWFVSQISTSASAAVGVAFSLMSMIQAFGFGIGLGCGSIISRRLGEKKNDEANVYASSALAAAITVGLIVGVLGLIFLEPLMKLLGSTETMLPYSCAYSKYILIGAPVMCSSFILSAILRSEGEATLSMIGLCAGGILNIALDPLFIFVFNMGSAGAALATVISQCVSCSVLGYSFLSGRSNVKIKPAFVSRRAREYITIISTGAPTIFRQGLASLASACLNIQASAYSDAAIAAVTIANKVYLLVRYMVIGIGQSFQPVAGYNYGAGNKNRTREAFNFSAVLGTAVCVICAAVTAAFAAPIVGWFRNDPDVIAIGSRAITYGAMVLPFMAYSTYVNQLYQSLGFKAAATVLASCRQGICYLPLILILPGAMGITGVITAQPGADLLTFFISVPFQVYFFRKYLKTEK